jgi:hypothetical protein
MALWQADYILIPAGSGANVPKESRRDHEWWNENEFPDSYEKSFQNIFSKSQSWAENTDQYGEESGNIISVSSEYGKVIECYARFDLRIPAQDEYKAFLKFCQEGEIELLDERNEIVKASWSSFMESLKSSAAFQFVENPQEYFRNNLDRDNDRGLD